MDGKVLLNYRFQSLLMILLVFMAVMPFFNRTLLTDIAVTSILIAAIPSAGGNRKLLTACAGLALLAGLALWASHWAPGNRLFVLANSLDLVFILLITGMILAQVFSSPTVTRETIAGAVCAYFFIGLMWADVYAILETLAPGSFSGPGMEAGRFALLSPRARLSHFGYFSFVTLSTLGYGDITPVTVPSRNLAVLEAILGQLYLAVLIARLVGQQAGSGDNIRKKH
ncbi:MAG: potassium channel family protein [Thermodesulfobacteriota bacterium]